MADEKKWQPEDDEALKELIRETIKAAGPLGPDAIPHKVRERLRVYHEQTEPLVEYYQAAADKNSDLKFAKVDGVGSVEEIKSRIFSALG